MRWPTCWTTPEPAAWWPRASWSTQIRDALAKVSAIADVFVAPGTGAAYEAEPADRSWASLAELAAGSASTAEPECFVDDRDALSYLYTSGTTSFPKGVVGTHVSIYTGVDVQRAGLRLELR